MGRRTRNRQRAMNPPARKQPNESQREFEKRVPTARKTRTKRAK